jgi:hypothetical protein
MITEKHNGEFVQHNSCQASRPRSWLGLACIWLIGGCSSLVVTGAAGQFSPGGSMCGVINLGGKAVYIDCEILVWPWRPPIDFAQILIDYKTPVTDPEGPPDAGGPPPTPWKDKLTFLGSVLAGTGILQDAEMSAALGNLAANIGSRIASDAGVDVKFSFDAHREASTSE